MKETMVVDLSNLGTMRTLLQKIQQLKGVFKITIEERKQTRSLSQNAYWHSAFISPFLTWLREAYGDPSISHEQAHEVLKRQLLGVRERTLATGDVLELAYSTHDMSTEEFSLLMDKATVWLGEFCGIVPLPADVFVSEKISKITKRRAA